MKPYDTAITRKVNDEFLEQIIWKDEFNTGFINIDLEHKMLTDLINCCIALARAGNNDPTEIKTILNKMADYANTHFKHEEKILMERQYPHFEEHKHEHQLFVAQLNDMMAHFKEEKLTSFETLKFLKDWLLHHILEMDMQYVAYCNR